MNRKIGIRLKIKWKEKLIIKNEMIKGIIILIGNASLKTKLTVFSSLIASLPSFVINDIKKE